MAVSRDVAVSYKETLDRLNGPDSALIISTSHNDEERLARWGLPKEEQDRLVERAELVQAEANRKLHRLDNIVGLDEDQADRAFGLMARGAKGFDPSMAIDGVSSETSPLDRRSRDQAIMELLRPEQIEAYHAHRRQEFEEAQRELGEIGLALPPDWDLWDEDDF